ncbi:hypothetical protein J1614_000516 [Plenodomus biglobosus]|nr:hypothetical protein J1614_000516 [Plenodomus biglobosus]
MSARTSPEPPERLRTIIESVHNDIMYYQTVFTTLETDVNEFIETMSTRECPKVTIPRHLNERIDEFHKKAEEIWERFVKYFTRGNFVQAMPPHATNLEPLWRQNAHVAVAEEWTKSRKLISDVETLRAKALNSLDKL